MKNHHVIGAQTVQRAVRVLRLAVRDPEVGTRLVDIAREMDLERPTAHRLLKALSAEGLLQQTPSRRYIPGPLLFELSLVMGGHMQLMELCKPALKELAQETGDTSFLFVRKGNKALCLDREQGPYPIQTPVVEIGSLQPLGVSSGGLAILSSLPENEARHIVSAAAPHLARYGALNTEKLWNLYVESKKNGYAVIADTAASGVRGVGVAICSSLGTPLAGLTVASTISRMSPEKVLRTLPLLFACQQQISATLQSAHTPGAQ